MRIDAYSQIQQMYSASKPANKVASAPKGASFKDKLDISNAGKDLQVAREAVAQAPDVRMDKVEQYKSMIANGSYNVSSEDFAERMLEKFSQTLA